MPFQRTFWYVLRIGVLVFFWLNTLSSCVCHTYVAPVEMTMVLSEQTQASFSSLPSRAWHIFLMPEKILVPFISWYGTVVPVGSWVTDSVISSCSGVCVIFPDRLWSKLAWSSSAHTAFRSWLPRFVVSFTSFTPRARLGNEHHLPLPPGWVWRAMLLCSLLLSLVFLACRSAYFHRLRLSTLPGQLPKTFNTNRW